jgi:hypothetical protein
MECPASKTGLLCQPLPVFVEMRLQHYCMVFIRALPVTFPSSNGCVLIHYLYIKRFTFPALLRLQPGDGSYFLSPKLNRLNFITP